MSELVLELWNPLGLFLCLPLTDCPALCAMELSTVTPGHSSCSAEEVPVSDAGSQGERSFLFLSIPA